MPGTSPTHLAVEAIWKMESAKLIAGLVRTTRDIGIAEELAQDAFVAAMQQWPASGIPTNPGAWLMTTARNRGIDRIRRDTRLREIQQELRPDTRSRANVRNHPDLDDILDGAVEDDLLRLIFTACHPILSNEARAAITLRLLCGMTTDEIARAFLVSEPTIAQRIVRAKRTLAEGRVPFEVPSGTELADRLASVLEVIYLLFNEGYSATAGDDWMRPALCEEALRLGRILAQLMPREPEVHGLVALMEIHASRTRARLDPAGKPVLLLQQDRALWDQLLIRRGLAALLRAQALRAEPGPYTLQASIVACHARARTAEETNWQDIIQYYDLLAPLTASPIVELNRAVAISMAFGPQAGLELVDALISEPLLVGYHLLPSVRGDFLFKLGRFREAQAEFERAASLSQNARERQLLLDRAAACKPESANGIGTI